MCDDLQNSPTAWKRGSILSTSHTHTSLNPAYKLTSLTDSARRLSLNMRQACDRCHAKKTKCPKHPGASSCIRCAKAGAQCVFSPTATRPSFRQYEPALPPLPPVGAKIREYVPPGPVNTNHQPQHMRWEHRWSQNGTSHIEQNLGDVMPETFQHWPNPSEMPVDPNLTPEIPMDPSLGIELVDPNLTPELVMDPNLATPTEALDPSLEATPEVQQLPGPEDSQPDVKQLMDFMVALDAVHRSFPSNEMHHTSKENIQQWADTLGNRIDLKAQLESILDHASRLGVLYPFITKLASPSKGTHHANDNCTVPACIHQDSFAQDSMPAPSIDYALLNVLVGCHTKLLDILELLLGHGRVCGQVVSLLPKDQEPSFDIPEIRVGKFVATKDRAVTYFVTFLADLLGSLSRRVGEVESMAGLSDAKREREARVLGLQCEILKDRSDEVMKGLVDLKEDMTKRGLVH